MKVLVDGGNSGSGGYLHYLSGILGSGGLTDVEIVLVCSPALAARVGPLDPQVTVMVEVQLDAPRRRTRLLWWRHTWPRLVAAVRPDVILHPTGLLRGDSGRVPRVSVHHSMAPFTSSTFRLYGASRMSAELLFWRVRLLRSFRRADGVIFHTEFTRAVVTRQAGRIARTALVPNAVSRSFTATGDRDTAVLPDPVRLLCVSTLHLFKHQWHVVAAVSALRQDLGLDLRLDFVGGGESLARARLHRSIKEHGAAGWTTVREVSPVQMPQVHQQADLFVFASSVEAWPITLGEAMLSGLPIACSDRMAMPEILGDAGTYFDPEDPPSIAAALRLLLTDPELRGRSAALAQKHASAYTWERSAAEVVEFLRHVIRENR